MPQQMSEIRTRLSALSSALKDLHRTLVSHAQKSYQSQWGEIGNAAQLLQLLTTHPHFDWLRRLSEFIIGIDELADSETLAADDARSALAAAVGLITPAASDTSAFSTHYLEALHGDPAVVMAHAGVRKLLAPGP